MTVLKSAIKTNLIVLTCLSTALMTGALASEDLAKAKNCLACHAIDTKLVGPAYKDVAIKYAAQAGAEDMLVQKVLKGSKGTWGFIPMPANAQVSQDEAHALVKWILNLQ